MGVDWNGFVSGSWVSGSITVASENGEIKLFLENISQPIADAEEVKDADIRAASNSLYHTFGIPSPYFSGSLVQDPLMAELDRQVNLPKLNEKYVNLINDILKLATSFDPHFTAVPKIIRIREAYTETGILTKKEMQFLNEVYKLLSFEAKHHPDKETTIGRIKTLLGGLND